MKIGFAELKMNDRVALRFEFFGPRKDRQRAFPAHD
jgi:hypothetical protein